MMGILKCTGEKVSRLSGGCVRYSDSQCKRSARDNVGECCQVDTSCLSEIAALFPGICSDPMGSGVMRMPLQSEIIDVVDGVNLEGTVCE
jgi:hypothetical protein